MSKRRFWTPEEDALLGTDIAPVIAERIGRTVGAVRRRRCTLGIPAVRAEFLCQHCGEPVAESSALGAPRRFCNVCVSQRAKLPRYKQRALAYHHRNRQSRNAIHRRYLLKSKYGITPEDYDALLAAQGGACALCSAPQPNKVGSRFYIDHDHASGAVRGLLCGPCNMGLGQFRDDPDLLRAAAQYVERNRLRLLADGGR